MNTGKLRGCLASVVLAEHVAEEVHYPVTVAVFVVVPREGVRMIRRSPPSPITPSCPPRSLTPSSLPGNELHEVVVESDAGFSIEDG